MHGVGLNYIIKLNSAHMYLLKYINSHVYYYFIFS